MSLTINTFGFVPYRNKKTASCCKFIELIFFFDAGLGGITIHFSKVRLRKLYCIKIKTAAFFAAVSF